MVQYGRLQISVLINLFKSYCCSFYGSHLGKSWSIAVRKLLHIDGNASKPLFSKMDNFQETQKTDFKSSYFFLICDHLQNTIYKILWVANTVYTLKIKKTLYIMT